MAHSCVSKQVFAVGCRFRLGFRPGGISCLDPCRVQPSSGGLVSSGFGMGRPRRAAGTPVRAGSFVRAGGQAAQWNEFQRKRDRDARHSCGRGVAQNSEEVGWRERQGPGAAGGPSRAHGRDEQTAKHRQTLRLQRANTWLGGGGASRRVAGAHGDADLRPAPRARPPIWSAPAQMGEPGHPAAGPRPWPAWHSSPRAQAALATPAQAPQEIAAAGAPVRRRARRRPGRCHHCACHSALASPA
jgi:hypothetical protein